MDRRLAGIIGLGLILLGVIALALSFMGVLFGFRIWDLWPISVIGIGLLLIAPAVLSKDRPGLGWLYVPGLPVLATGAILFLASVFHWWRIWAFLWPLEAIATALAFLLVALRTRTRGLLIPAVLIGINGIILQFCAITGWWGAWSVLWTVEPLAVGIALLAVNTQRRSRSVQAVGLVLCAIGALGFLEALVIAALTSIRPLWWLWRWLTPVTLILIGAGLLVGIAIRRETMPEAVPVTESTSGV